MKITLNKENLKTEFEENKELLVPIVVLIAAVMLFMMFIIPSLLSFPSKKGERDVEVSRLNQIKVAKDILEGTGDEIITEEVDLTSSALPSDKNFELILGAISQAASNSNAQIVGYKFSDSSNPNLTEENSLPVLTFIVSISGGIDQAANFANQLLSTSPISEVKSISFTNGISEVTVDFFYKSFTSVPSDDAALAREKSVDEGKALEQISKWDKVNTVTDLEFLDPGAATQSASPF